MYPVETLYSKQPESDYLDAALITGECSFRVVSSFKHLLFYLIYCYRLLHLPPEALS
jgi:hypothetical protein